MTKPVPVDPSAALTLPEMERQIVISGKWLERRDSLCVNAAAALVVGNDAQFNAATEMLSQVTKHSNAAEAERKRLSKPFSDAARRIKALVDKARKPLEDYKLKIKAATNQYAKEQRERERREREEAERKAREEAEKRVAEQQVEEELFGDAKDPEPVQVETEAVAHRAVSSTARVVEFVKVGEIDIERIPRAFMVPDMRKIGEYVRAHGDEIKARLRENPDVEVIEGVKLVIETDTRSR